MKVKVNEDALNHLLYESAKWHTRYDKLLALVKRITKESCCLCRDQCLRCDAVDLLKEYREWEE